MQTGAVVMMDALGYRDAIAEWSGENILKKMHALSKAAHDRLADNRDTYQSVNLRVPTIELAFLSDTVVICVAADDGVPPHDAIRTAAYTAASIMDEALGNEPHFLYRGCMTMGEFAVSDRFIVGKAVSVAAALADRAQGAFVWLDQTAREALGTSREGRRAARFGLFHWKVPLKGGDEYETLTVTPFGAFHDADQRQQILLRASGSFDRGRPNLDVLIKKQRTVEFLTAADEYFTTTNVFEPGPVS